MVAETYQGGFAAGHPVLMSFGLLLLYPVIRIVYNLYFHPLSRVPGPSRWACSRLPFIRSLLRGTIIHDFERMHRKYGPVLRVAPNEVTFASKDAWPDIHQPRPGHQPFLKDPLWWKAQPDHPDSIINAISPDVHAKIRKTLAPGFTPRALKAQEPFIQKYVNLLVERIAERTEAAPGKGVELDICPWMNFAAFDIFGDLGFGESFTCLESSEYHPWIALLFNSVKAASFVAAARFYPLVEFILMKCIPPSLKKMQADHYQHIADRVDRRLNLEMSRPDLMSHVNQQRSGEKGLSADEISATFMVLTTAGSETTATTLCGAFNELIAHPEKLSRLTKEVRSAFQTREQITLEAVKNLPYLNAVIHESLRLCPAIPWVLSRLVPPGGDTVCGTWLPGGTPVSIQAYTLNRDPGYFHKPTSFAPERWLPDASTDSNSPYYHDDRQAIQPFSMGPRNCMGQHLAWAEMRLILSKLLFTFDMEAVKGKEVRWEDLRTFVLVEKQPIIVRITPRVM
ncbi:isotrichodermin C-15 hydroxylase [Lentithecium fluviatile CBS 122367]|uniref:Isotrichodermin C-15 hydroxylase n=1 Tax=Lentithecium fluviatile CBS 122367 TaxID=1168545 RepID=A0A6G1IW30_9PLEO|nr:isotrichodermin C-15 hydroxylase [Lentithecium fluviatile CBS 122367]